jgi:hypothetical protein
VPSVQISYNSICFAQHPTCNIMTMQEGSDVVTQKDIKLISQQFSSWIMSFCETEKRVDLQNMSYLVQRTSFLCDSPCATAQKSAPLRIPNNLCSHMTSVSHSSHIILLSR